MLSGDKSQRLLFEVVTFLFRAIQIKNYEHSTYTVTVALIGADTLPVLLSPCSAWRPGDVQAQLRV